jgi:microcystin-dependent protein
MATTPKTRRVYKGAATPTTITTTISNTADAVSITTATGWPTVGPFYAVIDPGLSTEEKIYVGAITGTALSSITRGADDTAGVGHDSGATIYPVFTATDADEANQLTATYTTKGGIVYMGDPSFTQLAIGSTTGHALKVSSTGVPEWGQLASAGIANGAVVEAKIDSGAVTLAKLAAAVASALVPVGTINAYAGATAPTGWLLCNGQSTTGYPTLAALVGATAPDLRGRFPIGKTSSGTGSTLLGTGGSTAISTSNMPDHNHGPGTLAIGDAGAHSHTGGTADAGSHSHSGGTGYAGVHQHDYYRTSVKSELVQDIFDILDTTVAAETLEETSIPNEGDGTHFHPIDADGIHNHAIPEAPNHSHTITGVTTGAGLGTAYFQPFVSVNYIIKHD